jgi:peptidoglycan/xylan/chitin deacetylase (PgdA/CDA1 family)
VVVFLFHGVLRERRDTGVRNYTGKHLPLREFESFLDELLEDGVPLSVPRVADGARGEEVLPDRGFAITFDDGFANNLEVAAPALEARSIPATFYVTTDFVDHQGCSWIDLIEHAVDAADGGVLSLPFLETTLDSHGAKIAALDVIRKHGKLERAGDPYALADDVRRQLGISALPIDAELDRKLTWDEAREIAEHPLFTVGGHGASHRILSHVDPSELDREVDGSLDQLDAELGRRTLHFSYPEGGPGTYTDVVLARLQARGIASAAVVAEGRISRGDDPFVLRRTLVS